MLNFDYDAAVQRYQQAYDQAKACMAKEGITAEAASPFTDSNGFAVTQEKAKQLGGITTLSDLKGKAQDLRISGPPECQQRTDCLLGLEQTYGLKFKKFVSIDLAKRHEVIKNGQTDVGEVFTTDGQLQGKKYFVLKDPKNVFGFQNVAPVVSNKVAAAGGAAFAKIVNAVSAKLSVAAMRAMNKAVAIDKQSPAAVAGTFLKANGLK